MATTFKTTILTSGFLLLGSAAMWGADSQNGSGEVDGYKLVWQDLFDNGELNRQRWNIEVNGDGGGNNELQYYTDHLANVRVGDDGQGNGCLILTARREDYKGKHFTSGRVNSKNLIAFKHGKLEASIKLPKTANGLWPAFWAMGNDYDEVGWPRCGETDIMEFGHQNGIKNNVTETFFNGACHWGTMWNRTGDYARDCNKSYSLQDGEFHLWTLIWDENQIAMYVDMDRTGVHVPYFKMDISRVDEGDDMCAGNYFHKENFILFNLAVGGNFPGIHNAECITALNDENGQQASMYINYVKIYQKGENHETKNFNEAGDPDGSTGVTAMEAEPDVDVNYSNQVYSSPNSELELFDMSGRRVASASEMMSIEGVTPGAYVLKVSCGAACKTIKIIK